MDCDQMIYVSLFLLIGLFIYKQMCSTNRNSRIPKAYNYNFEAARKGYVGGPPSSMGGVSLGGGGGNGGDVIGGCPANIDRQQQNANNAFPVASEEDISNDESYRTVDYGQQGQNSQDIINKSCYPQTILSSKDLLPGYIKADISKFKEEASKKIGEGILDGISYLDAGFHVGVNTVGQSLRNANKQLRSEPSNPQVAVSPWLMSSIGPDLDRRPLENSTCLT
jgi:hypothetical protein